MHDKYMDAHSYDLQLIYCTESYCSATVDDQNKQINTLAYTFC